MHIKILGTGCAKCKNLEAKVRNLVAANNISAEITKVSSIEGISAYGIVMTPGLVIDERLISVGSVPSESQILKWINEVN